MRKRNQMKKGIAALLSGVLAFGMTAGVIPGFEDSMQSVRAVSYTHLTLPTTPYV